MEMYMNLDPQMVNQLLNAIPYPISKTNLIQMAQQIGANDQIIGMLRRLPDKTFNSPQDIQKALEGMGNIGQSSKQ
jgi:Protein of unknown function (DUF2795)